MTVGNSQYFKDRPSAGRMLADKLEKFASEKCAVLSLSEGGVLVGAQIAMRLHCHLMLLSSERIVLPGEHEAIAAMTVDSFGYSGRLSESEIDYMNGEFHGVIEGQRITKQHALNRLVNEDTKITPEDLKDKIVIVVSDGFTDTLSLDVLEDFIRPIRIKRLVIAAPLTNVKALDKMHLLADELAILNVREDIISVDHHYDKNTIPPYQDLVKIIKNTV